MAESAKYKNLDKNTFQAESITIMQTASQRYLEYSKASKNSAARRRAAVDILLGTVCKKRDIKGRLSFFRSHNLLAIGLLIAIVFVCSCTLQSPSAGPVAIPVEIANLEPSNSSSQAKSKTDEHLIWSGKSGKYRIRWTKDDLTIQSTGSPSSSEAESIFSSIAKRGFADSSKYGHSPDTPNGCFFPNTGVCYYVREFRVVSVFGDLLTFEDRYEAYGGKGGTGVDQRFTTIDIDRRNMDIYDVDKQYGVTMSVHNTRRSRSIGLDEIFDGSEIVREMAKIPEIKEAFDSHKIDHINRSASDVAKQINKLELREILFKNDSFVIDDQFLTRFAVVDIDPEGKAVVMLMMPSSGGYAAPDPTYVSLTLTIPEKTRASLEKAQSTNEGFLKKYSDEVLAGRSTEIRWEF